MEGVADCAFFFFQAEDGIRDVAVTGVQTCALPILGVAMQSFSGGVALLLAGLLSGEFHRFHFAGVSRASWVALAYLIVFGSCIGLSAYLYILQKRSEEHTSELQSRLHLVCRLLLE